MNTLKEELKSMDKSQLKDKVEELRRDYFGMRLNAGTAHLKDYSQFKKIRKSIAQTLTLLNNKVK